MFYLEIILLLITICEIYDLWKKNLKKSALKVSILSFISIVFSLIILIPSLKEPYSNIMYLVDLKTNNFLVFLLWLIVTILYLVLIFRTTKLKKQNKKLSFPIYIIGLLRIMYLLLILFHNIAPWLILFSFIFIIYYTIKSFLDSKKIKHLILAIVTIILTFNLFFTYHGAVRLNILLNGYPISAIETGIEEISFNNDDLAKQYYPVKNIPVASGEMGIILVKKYFGFIKIAKYIGF